MIRNTRTYVAVQTVGALASLGVLLSWSVSPPMHPVFPMWCLIGIAAFTAGSFAYNIVMTLRGRPIPVASWARNLSDRQLWTMKGVLIAAMLAVAVVVIFRR